MEIRADHAVYVPDLSRPGGGSITFTGHVKMILTNPGALVGDSTSTMDQAVVLLGLKPQYPQVQADNINGSAVPSAVE